MSEMVVNELTEAEKEEIKYQLDKEERMELNNEAKETAFDCWVSDNRGVLEDDFLEEYNDKFMEFCRTEYKERD
jgi:hypothetical protein